ncbi:MAG: peptide-methionine (S)-S-oxide reductase [Gramella sp.]|nr:peptide-methionine (S)-S-oxide reductase [Christiangramia sp.]
MIELDKIGLGGGCHWCTEAVFQVLAGVNKVEQGYISTNLQPENYHEGVIVHFDPEKVNLEDLLMIHLHTHKSTSNHSMRDKYMSAVFAFHQVQYFRTEDILKNLQEEFDGHIITSTVRFGNFKPSRPEIQNYYKTDPGRPFCTKYIEPKLKLLTTEFKRFIK